MNILYKTNVIFILFLILTIQCKQEKRSNISKSEIIQINIEECLQSTRNMNLSEIADSIEYLQLSTPKGLIITSIREVKIMGDYIGLISKGTAYLFLRNGQFVCKLGGKGKGPGEYLSATGISFDHRLKRIIVFATNCILFYNLNGNFLQSLNTQYNIPIYFKDSVIWTERDPLGIFKTKVIAFNYDMDTIAIISNYDFFSHRNGNAFIKVGSKYQESVYEFNSNLYYKGSENNDTIWQLLLPKPTVHAVIKMGKYKLPFEYRADYSLEDFKKNASKYYGIPRILENENYFFLMAQTRKSELIYDKLIIFDKQKKSGCVIMNNTVLGIRDDILNGPSFWPLFNSDDYFIGIIEAYELLEKLKTVKSSSFQNLPKNINENSNQLLILCKKKNYGNKNII